MGFFNSMLSNVYGRLSAAFGDHRAFNFKYAVNVFYVASLCSAHVYFVVFTQFTLCHKPVMLLMLHALTRDAGPARSRVGPAS